MQTKGQEQMAQTTPSWQAAVTTQQKKKKTKKVLHVFGGQGNRGVLDLSRFASRNFRFVSEDLEIKSNTPQVGEVQEATPTRHKKGGAEGKAVEGQQTAKPLRQDVQPCACGSS